jgi:sec-independent protein translocase protein TatA
MPFTPGPVELIIVLVIALLVLGPGKLPEVGASLGKTLREFRNATSDVKEAATIDTRGTLVTTRDTREARPVEPEVAPDTNPSIDDPSLLPPAGRP